MKTHLSYLLVIACLAVLAPIVAGGGPQDPTGDQEAKPKTQEAFELAQLVRKARESKREYLPFLDRKTLSTGLYRLPAGATDGQRPHALDEVYHVVEGRAHFTADDVEREVGPGSILFVAAGIEHRFHDIEQDLTVVVFFSKARHPGDKGK